MEILKFILTKLLEIYMVLCTVVTSILILLFIFGRRQLKKIDKRIYNIENTKVH